MKNAPSTWEKLYRRIQGRTRRDMSCILARRMARISSLQPVISFTFDDFPCSAVKIGAAFLHQRGIRATFYASFGLMNSMAPTGRIFGLPELHALEGQGHEIGCHTHAHCHAWETSTLRYEQSIQENRTALAGLLPKASFTAHAYPISCPKPSIKSVAGRHFGSCRGGVAGFNSAKVDLNNLKSVFLEKNLHDFSAIKQLITDNHQAKGWLILTTHDIAENPTPFGVTPAFFAETVECAISSGARILPISAALHHVIKPEAQGTDRACDKSNSPRHQS